MLLFRSFCIKIVLTVLERESAIVQQGLPIFPVIAYNRVLLFIGTVFMPVYCEQASLRLYLLWARDVR